MEGRKFSPRQVFYVSAPLALALCLAVLLITFSFLPFSKLFLLIAAGIGVILSAISITRLTGGGKFSGWDFFIFAVGFGIAQAVAADETGGAWWAWGIQFLAASLCVELGVLIAFRSRIERFNSRRASL